MLMVWIRLLKVHYIIKSVFVMDDSKRAKITAVIIFLLCGTLSTVGKSSET